MKTAKSAPVAQKKILIVEDEGEMRFVLDLLLNGEGMTIDHVKSLAEARAYLAGERPSLVLLDNRLPDGLGLDFIGFLRENYPDVKILMISGIDPAAADVAIESGANRFLPKPFTRKELFESVHSLVS